MAEGQRVNPAQWVEEHTSTIFKAVFSVMNKAFQQLHGGAWKGDAGAFLQLGEDHRKAIAALEGQFEHLFYTWTKDVKDVRETRESEESNTSPRVYDEKKQGDITALVKKRVGQDEAPLLMKLFDGLEGLEDELVIAAGKMTSEIEKNVRALEKKKGANLGIYDHWSEGIKKKYSKNGLYTEQNPSIQEAVQVIEQERGEKQADYVIFLAASLQDEIDTVWEQFRQALVGGVQEMAEEKDFAMRMEIAKNIIDVLGEIEEAPGEMRPRQELIEDIKACVGGYFSTGYAPGDDAGGGVADHENGPHEEAEEIFDAAMEWVDMCEEHFKVCESIGRALTILGNFSRILEGLRAQRDTALGVADERHHEGGARR